MSRTPPLTGVVAVVVAVVVTVALTVWSVARSQNALVKAAETTAREHAERARVLEAEVAQLESTVRTASAAQVAARRERAAADLELALVREDARRAVARVRTPVAPAVRAERVVRTTPGAVVGDVVPLVHAGREGYWVAEATFIELEAAKTASVSAWREVQALVHARDAERDRADAAVTAARAEHALAERYRVYGDAEAFARADLERRILEAPPPTTFEEKLLWAGGGAAVAGAVIAVVVLVLAR